MNRRKFQVFFYKLNRRRVLYPLWLFFLFNVFTMKQLTIGDTGNDVKELENIVEDTEQPSTLQEPEKVKTILMWNPWYGDFGFTLDDDSAFR